MTKIKKTKTTNCIIQLPILLFLFIVFYTLARGKKCEANPWGEGADTLEWTVESPAPFHTHEELPRVR